MIGFFTILNVRIDGIREEDNETWLNTETKAKEVLQEKLNLSFEPVIERAHRTGTRSRPGAADGFNTRPRTSVVYVIGSKRMKFLEPPEG